MLAPEPEEAPCSVVMVPDLLYSSEYLATDNKLQWLQTKLIIGPQKAREISELTAGQRNNMLWAAARKLRLTSSVFGQVLKAFYDIFTISKSRENINNNWDMKLYKHIATILLTEQRQLICKVLLIP